MKCVTCDQIMLDVRGCIPNELAYNYGDEPDLNDPSLPPVELSKRCGDCACFKGEPHHAYCDMAVCRFCDGQLLQCRNGHDYGWPRTEKELVAAEDDDNDVVGMPDITPAIGATRPRTSWPRPTKTRHASARHTRVCHQSKTRTSTGAQSDDSRRCVGRSARTAPDWRIRDVREMARVGSPEPFQKHLSLPTDPTERIDRAQR
jgi:hypothetical protein